MSSAKLPPVKSARAWAGAHKHDGKIVHVFNPGQPRSNIFVGSSMKLVRVLVIPLNAVRNNKSPEAVAGRKRAHAQAVKLAVRILRRDGWKVTKPQEGTDEQGHK